jgi:outer membrane protein TolC
MLTHFLTYSATANNLIQTSMYFSEENILGALFARRAPWSAFALACALASGGVRIAAAQMPFPSSASQSRPLQLPLSARQPSGVSVQQTATPPQGASVNTVNVQIQAQGPYSGSVAGPNPPAGTVTLTLADAVRRGLESNLGIVGAGTSSQLARAQRRQALSALLPNVSASASENAEKINLAVEGFTSSAFGTSIPFPTTVGPFHYYDVSGSLRQSVLDFTALHDLRASTQLANSSELDAHQAREEVVLAVSGVYLQLMATIALVDEQEKEVEFAEATYKQARAQADAGNKAPIDANRSQVELQTERQRLRSQRGDLEKQKNQLARLIGLPLGLDIQIEEKLAPLNSQIPSLQDSVQRAWTQREDLKATEAQLSAAREARKAAGAEHLPSIAVNGTYGLEGVDPNHGSGVFQASAGLSVPLFQGGRIKADVAQADAVVTQRDAELSDEHGVVELDVRNAYIDLNVANDQVSTAQSNRDLALATLQQSQDRFAVGVADSVEVVNSQQALAAADHDYVSSLFAQYLARITLAHAMGEAEKDLPDLFKRN